MISGWFIKLRSFSLFFPIGTEFIHIEIEAAYKTAVAAMKLWRLFQQKSKAKQLKILPVGLL